MPSAPASSSVFSRTFRGHPIIPIIRSSKVLIIAGPTASGKSALALALAGDLGAEIVNADAFQIYRGLEILTAAPSAADRARVPHHLYGVLDPAEPCDAARYAGMARTALAEIASRGKPALVVGGSGLYLKALTHGLSDLPNDPELRTRLIAQPLDEKIATLRKLDPSGAVRLNLSNPRYVERALEICLLTGRPASEARAAWDAPDPPGLRGFLLTWPREELYRRIDTRVEAMVSPAVLEEVGALREVSPTAEKAIGLRDIRALLAGQLPRAQAVATIQQATRRYAKRQLTWFRRERWLTTVSLDAGATPSEMAATLLARPLDATWTWERSALEEI